MHVFHSLCSPLISGRDMCILVWKPSLCSVFKLLDEYLHIQRFWMFLRWRQSFLQKFVWWLVGQIMIHIWDVLGNFVKSKIIRKKLLMCVHCKVRHPEYVGIGAETHEQKWPYNMFAPQFTWKITKSTFFFVSFCNILVDSTSVKWFEPSWQCWSVNILNSCRLTKWSQQA